MLDDNSKHQQRKKLRMILYVVFIFIFIVYLVVASYFIDTLYHYRFLNATLQLTQNLTKAPLGSYATEVLVSYVPQFISLTGALALALVWIEGIDRIIKGYIVSQAGVQRASVLASALSLFSIGEGTYVVFVGGAVLIVASFLVKLKSTSHVRET